MLLQITNPDLDAHYRLSEAQQRARSVVGDVSRLMDFMVYAYELAPHRDIRWSVIVAQGIHETDWMRSPVSLDFNNTAGIKNGPFTHPSTPSAYRFYNSIREGTQDHIDLLAVYCGTWVPDMPDTSRNTRVANIVYSRLGGRYALDLTDLNGIWAWPGTSYGQNIYRTWKRLFE